jgi:hypothetical protein
LREGLEQASALKSRVRFVALLAAFIGVLAADSRPRIVGDGHEYVAMTWNMSQLRLPALTAAELTELEALLPPRPEGYNLLTPELRSSDGRLTFYHPWAYSLVAAPLVAGALWLHKPVLLAFTILNVLLLATAAFVALKKCGARVTLLVFGGAIIWWVDKAHSEVFTLALAVAAIVLLPTQPALSLVLQGLVGLQNSILAANLLASVLWLWRRHRLRDSVTCAGLAGACVLILMGPAYYLWRIGRLSPLSATVFPHWPGWTELTAVLIDTNLGLFFAWPSLCAAVLLAMVAGARTATIRAHAHTLALLAGTGLIVLFAVTQPGNLNHGGTRSVSRYALLLVPLLVPLLVHFDKSSRQARVILLALAAGSLGTALTEYRPRAPERYVYATALADWVWRRWPEATNPLPEVFAERTAHVEGPASIPTATVGCEKALLVGEGGSEGAWPLWCEPTPLPPACWANGTHCYANQTASGRSFSVAPRQPAFKGPDAPTWYWRGKPTRSLVRFLAGIPWQGLRPADPRSTQELFAARRGLGRVQGRIDPEILVVWIDRPRASASVTLYPRPDYRAVLIDTEQAIVLDDRGLDPKSPTTMAIPYRSPLLLAVVPASLVPTTWGPS